ncbi:hypothetical protein AVEN_240131-1 [Araneus ventricosus]|uniref:Uncharacterized protein n=1 Tax=Araneus ventricosus TaxID=182803 RepID=A0A4Y2PA69_ARAVE|nr:hypothetical protein AVEN_240131-1 [Araneus ventricosus]
MHSVEVIREDSKRNKREERFQSHPTPKNAKERKSNDSKTEIRGNFFQRVKKGLRKDRSEIPSGNHFSFLLDIGEILKTEKSWSYQSPKEWSEPQCLTDRSHYGYLYSLSRGSFIFCFPHGRKEILYSSLPEFMYEREIQFSCTSFCGKRQMRTVWNGNGCIRSQRRLDPIFLKRKDLVVIWRKAFVRRLY